MLLELLEPRRFFDIAIVGGEGHTGIAVEVWNPQGTAVVGTYQADYAGSSWIEGGAGNVLTGTQGRIDHQYTPGRDLTPNNCERYIQTTPEQDKKVLDNLNVQGATVIADPTKPQSGRTDAVGEWASYAVATGTTCYGWTAALLNVGLRNEDKNPPEPYPSPKAIVTYGDLMTFLQYWMAIPADGQRHKFTVWQHGIAQTRYNFRGVVLVGATVDDPKGELIKP